MTASKRNDVLKLIALLTMLIDHIGYLFYPDMMIFRTIGRIAFPIFAYQLAQGFIHTSNRRQYASRLAIFGLISAIPYAFFNPQLNFDPLSMNIMFLLLMGAGAMALWELAADTWKQKQDFKNRLWSGLFFVSWLLWMTLPRFLMTTFTDISLPFLAEPFALKLSYAGYGLWMMMLFYWFGKKPIIMLCSYIGLSIIGPLTDGYFAYAMAYMDVNTISYIGVIGYSISNFAERLGDIVTLQGGLANLQGFFFQSRSVLGLLVILLLRDRAFAFKMPKYVAYWFYPVHMTILMLVLKFGLI